MDKDIKFVSFVVNNKQLTIRTTTSEAFLLQTDDDYAVNYIKNSVSSGKLTDLELFPEATETLEIARLNIDGTETNETNEHTTSEQVTNPTNADDIIWKSKGKPTTTDIDAINYMLELRGSEKYVKRFNDKRTVKISLWNEIANEMEEVGYKLGAKSNAEKVRQKFLNLSKLYTQYNSYVKNTTGTTPKNPPEFYDQLNAILGDKHKSHPTYITGSMKQVTGVEELNQTSSLSTIEPIELEAANLTFNNLNNEDENNKENEADNTNTNNEIQTSNRFKRIKNTVKPKNEKNSLLEEIKNICSEGNEIAREQSSNIHKLLQEQNDILKENSREQIRQRDKMLKIMEKLISSKKRKHESDSESC